MMSLFSFIGVLGACACVGSSPILSHVVNDVAIVENNKVQPKLASYDDENYTITLSADELNNYTWDNLVNHLSSLVTNPSVIGVVNYGSYTNKSLSWRYDTTSLFYSLQSTFGQPAPMIVFNRLDSGKFLYYENTSSEGVSLSENLTIVFNSDYYSLFKQAIELDIQANTGDINSGIFSTLTDSIVAFVGSLGSGITAMTSVFWDSANNQLTTIGLLSVIVVAVSLTYFLFRLIIGLIRMRG